MDNINYYHIPTLMQQNMAVSKHGIYPLECSCISGKRMKMNIYENKPLDFEVFPSIFRWSFFKRCYFDAVLVFRAFINRSEQVPMF